MMLSTIFARLLVSRLLNWTAALLVFLLMATLSTFIHAELAAYLFPALGALGALGLIWRGRRFRDRLAATEPPEPASPTRGRARFIVFLILLAALVSGWQSLAAPPHRIIDTWEYFIGSDQLLGDAHTYASPEAPGYFQDAIITYGYPLFISLTRLVGGDVSLLIVLQHLFRIAALVAVVLVIWTFDNRLAKVTGILLALSPITANAAHLMLTEGLYAPLVALLAITCFLAATRSAVGWLILAGMIAALIAWIRPVGTYLVIPILLLLILAARDWKKTLPALVSFAGILLLVSAGRYGIDRHFTFQTTAQGLYYYSIVVFHDLFDEANGANTQAFADAARDCPTNTDTLRQLYPPDTRAHDLERILHANDVLGCVARASPEIASRQTALVLEAARAKPLQFLRSFADEAIYFVTQMEMNILWQSSAAPICDQAYALAAYDYDDGTHARFRSYACGVSVPENPPLQTTFANYSVFFLFVSQPYLLLNLFYANPAVTFAGALVMVGFIWIEGSRYWRWLLLCLCVIIAYHAFISGIFYSIPRYVMVLNGLFVIVAAMFYTILSARLAASLHAAAARKAGRTQAQHARTQNAD